MNRPEQELPSDASAAGERFWQAFAHAAGFEDELRELAASGEFDVDSATLSFSGSAYDPTADDFLTADRLQELLLAVRETSIEPTTVELADRGSSERPAGRTRRRYAWLAPLSLVSLASVAAVAALFILSGEGTGTGNSHSEVASAERLAEEWFALRREARPNDVAFSAEAEFDAEEEFDLTEFDPTELDAEPAVDAFDFEETPDWLVLAIVHQTELAEESVEEATP